MTKRTATKANPYVYEWSGLRDVRLIGITVQECPKCAARSAVIPQVDGLHRVISHWLLRKQGRLEGAEIRFLRKNCEMPAHLFAEGLGITPEHLSRIENGRRDVSHQIDVLARVGIALCQESTDLREVLIGRRSRLIRFSSSSDKWELQVA
jgi:putative transcriptional regulator